MAIVNFPAEYQQVMPYLMMPQPGAFIQFVKEVLDGTEKMTTRDDDGTYRHCEVFIGKSVIMFSECMEGSSPKQAELFVYVADADAAYAKALELGATSVTAVGNQPYGRSGGVKDTNGNTWWLTTAN